MTRKHRRLVVFGTSLLLLGGTGFLLMTPVKTRCGMAPCVQVMHSVSEFYGALLDWEVPRGQEPTLPDLDTRSLPGWVTSAEGCRLMGYGDRLSMVLQRFQDEKEYDLRINPEVVGKRFSELPKETILIEVIGRPECATRGRTVGAGLVRRESPGSH